MTRRAYPSDVRDEEWALVLPYLTRAPLEAPQRKYDLREVFNALRWMVRTGAQWDYLPHDFPPPHSVQAQAYRWMNRGVFEDLVHDLRMTLRRLQGKAPHPSAAIYDARPLQSTPQRGERAGYDGTKRRKGSKVHLAVETLGHLLALVVTAGNEQETAQGGGLSQQVQEATGGQAEAAFVDQGYTGEEAAQTAEAEGLALCVVQVEGAKRGFVLLTKRWVVERSFAWTSRFRRLARDYERLAETLRGWHWLAFSILMTAKTVELLRTAS
ncbi:IS5 family transposase [Meiothermus ruber]|uniref:IS5 family transposase n=1 Tax=Meiothermus ruber TaxID=277 RepID=UPI00055FD37A|nr:IS5 family transposase [Meiothermus ruber]